MDIVFSLLFIKKGEENKNSFWHAVDSDEHDRSFDAHTHIHKARN